MVRPLGTVAGIGFLLGLGLVGCGPNPKPARVMALVPDDQGDLKPAQVELQTITDLTTLKGTAVEFIGGAEALIDSSDPVFQLSGGPEADARRYASFMKNRGMPVHANFIDKSGVLWPSDFHTWNMVTLFYNFERAYQYFEVISGEEPPTELQAMRVLYWADVRIDSTESLVDNALFLSLLKSFAVVPFKSLQKVPLAMNIAVIGHEMAHRVFNYRALSDAGFHQALVNWQLAPFNLLKSIDEGFADFHAYGVTCKEPSDCQSAFLEPSLPSASEVRARDLARTDLCLDAVTKQAFLNSTPGTWISPGGKMYVYGTLWAAALYQGASSGSSTAAIEELQKALLASYDDPTPTRQGLRQLIDNLENPADFTPEAVADVILSHISENALRTKVCSELLTRLQLSCKPEGTIHCKEMPHCPAASVADSKTCPPLP
jgi:hypothetical protein